MDKHAKPLRLQDLAEIAGVSVATASMALAGHPSVSPETRDRVRALGTKMGYRSLRPRTKARGSKIAPASRIGLVLMADTYRGERGETNAEMVHQFMTMAAAENLRIEAASIVDTHDPQEVQATLRRFARGLDGLIIEGIVRAEDLTTIHETGVPMVAIGPVVREPGSEHALRKMRVQRVVADGVEMGRCATGWLLSRGHRRVAFVSEQFVEGFYHSQWLDGYRVAHLHAGLPPDPALSHTSNPPNGGVLSVYPDLARLNDPPTAFVLPDARTAASFLDGARRCGREIDSRNVVFSTTPALAKRYGLDTLPRLEVDTRQLAVVSLDILFRVRRHPPLGPLITIVPHVCYNMHGVE